MSTFSGLLVSMTGALGTTSMAGCSGRRSSQAERLAAFQGGRRG